MGIPEQIIDGKTGYLVPAGDSTMMADCIMLLLTDSRLRRQMVLQAAEDAQKRFDLNIQTNTYLKWYEQIVEQRRQAVKKYVPTY